MAKRHPVKPKLRRGPRGRGPAATADHAQVLKLSAQMNDVLKELQIQLTRIGQIQAQLDRLAAGQSPRPIERRKMNRTSH